MFWFCFEGLADCLDENWTSVKIFRMRFFVGSLLGRVYLLLSLLLLLLLLLLFLGGWDVDYLFMNSLHYKN